jgi:hypothetical protein
MLVDALALRLRPRTNLEACDLGVRLCQAAARSVFPCFLAVLLPVTALALATHDIAPWLPIVTIWCAKPWVDRAVLFALGRAAFGQPTALKDLWTNQRAVLWRALLATWLWRRLSPWRSLTQPVYQLEGQRGAQQRKRVALIRRGRVAVAGGVTFLFALAEWIFFVALSSLAFWFAPRGYSPDLTELFEGRSPEWVGMLLAGTYGTVIAFVEPFYVAAGFAMYLNRRAELEAWDIEQEFRRAFAQ